MTFCFSDALFEFLIDLELNNNRDWFHENKQRYEDDVRGPALAFIEAMARPMASISEHIVCSPKKVGGSLMRVHRDIRFSKDKTPYKTNVGIHFRHARGKDVHAPGYYLHLSADEVFVGVGVWHPDSKTLGAIRRGIDGAQDEWTSIVSDKALTATFRQGGESLKRGPKGFPKDHALIDELKRKDHILVADLQRADVTSGDAVTMLSERYARATPFVRFICRSIDLPF